MNRSTLKMCLVGSMLLLSALPGIHAAPGAELIGVARIPGDATDLSGRTEMMCGDVPHNRLGSFGSAIDYSGAGDRYVVLNDRGPSDGACAFECRFHVIEIAIDPGAEAPVRASVHGTHMLRMADGKPLLGLATACDDADAFMHARFDPEGIRRSPNGTIWVSDEYGPFIDEFGMDGARRRRLSLPSRFVTAQPDAALEMPPHARRGRQVNRGMEGLAISPDGSGLVGIMQSPLIQDGALDDRLERIGINVRMVQLDLRTQRTQECVYVLENPKHGVNEILAVNQTQFLVLERDGKGGRKAKFRGVFMIDTTDATDVSSVESLPASGLPDGVRPVSKRLLIDFMEGGVGLTGDDMPEKIEGMCFGPPLADGRRTLVVTSDNDFHADQPSVIWVFALDDADLKP